MMITAKGVNSMKPYLKTIGAFLALLATNIYADMEKDGFVWPTTWLTGLRWFLTIAIGTYAVWRLRNTPQPAARARRKRATKKVAAPKIPPAE